MQECALSVQEQERVPSTVEVIRALQNGDENVLRSLAQVIELKDPYTKGHCNRVSEYALIIAKALDISEDAVKEIRYGSWLHDCGKLEVPEALLNFNGPINNIDFETVKRHPEWGADMARQASLSDAIVNIILYHHERYDGNGYPEGLAGKEIPFEARIVAVADVYDALTTQRPYRKAYHWKKALNIITSMMGSVLDPEMAETFHDKVAKRR